MHPIKHIFLATGLALMLSACGDNGADPLDPKTKAELSEMSVSETFDYLEVQTVEVTKILKTVVDEGSAKAAIKDLQAQAPHLKAALESFEDIDESELSFGVLRKLPALLESQSELFEEFSRIQDSPEAREIIMKELDKLNLSDLSLDEN